MQTALTRADGPPIGAEQVHGGARQLAGQAATDEQLVALWLHGRPADTRRAYARDAARFFEAVGRPLGRVRLADVQAYADGLADLAPATRARRLNAVKSLFAFALRLGYVPFNVAAPVRAPAVKAARAERPCGPGRRPPNGRRTVGRPGRRRYSSRSTRASRKTFSTSRSASSWRRAAMPTSDSAMRKNAPISASTVRTTRVSRPCPRNSRQSRARIGESTVARHSRVPGSNSVTSYTISADRPRNLPTCR